MGEKHWFPKINDLLIPAWQQTQQTRPFSFLPTETQSAPTSTSILTLTPPNLTYPESTNSRTPSPTYADSTRSTATNQVSILALDNPIGKDVNFVIHRTAAGETLVQFASKYNTTIDAIRAINYELPSVLFVDQALVIPINIIDVADLPVFETYQVKANEWTVQQLTEKLSVATDVFRFYNNIPVNYIFDSGEWVLVPRERP